MKRPWGVQKDSSSPFKHFITSWILSPDPLTLRKSLVSPIFPHISCLLNLPLTLRVFPKKSCQPPSTSQSVCPIGKNKQQWTASPAPHPAPTPIPAAAGGQRRAARQAQDSPRRRCGCAASSGAADGPARSWVDCSEEGAGGRWKWWCGSCGPQKMPREQSTQWSMYVTYLS